MIEQKIYRVRTRLEQEAYEIKLVELGILSPAYTLSSKSKGRQKEETNLGLWRTCFEKDRDRIIHSHSYRILRDKAQVHILPKEQNLTTRLIHTEEVYQISDAICTFLRLNKTLAEAIARGHDLGHTPYGHIGESALTKIMRKYLNDDSYEFDHAKYGLDVVGRLERDGKGLNLTFEVIDGILYHSLGGKRLRDIQLKPFTPEGQVVSLADKIAYTCGDLEDAIRVGVIKQSDVPQAELKFLGLRKADQIGKLITSVVDSTIESGCIDFFGDAEEAFRVIKSFMYKNVYGIGCTQEQQQTSRRAIEFAFDHILHKKYSDLDQKTAAFKTLDDIACMTDVSLTSFVQEIVNEKFIPSEKY